MRVPPDAVPGVTIIRFKVSRSWVDARIQRSAAVRLQAVARGRAVRRPAAAFGAPPPSSGSTPSAAWLASINTAAALASLDDDDAMEIAMVRAMEDEMRRARNARLDASPPAAASPPASASPPGAAAPPAPALSRAAT